MSKLSFSGHESFQCRNLWLKKGFDHLQKGKEFSDDFAVVDLGVGNNMVTSIRFWLDAFGLKDEEKKDELSPLANSIFNNGGWDPYLEDIGTLWLLHYQLIARNKASIYSLVFNKFRREKIEFTKENLIDFLVNYSTRLGENHSPNTIDTDVGVFLKSYVSPKTKDSHKNVEDSYSSLLMELNLVKEVAPNSKEKSNWFRIESSEQETLPIEVFLYSILDNESYGSSISLYSLLNEENSPGNVFALHPDALVEKIVKLTEYDKSIIYKEDAGVKELQFKKKFEKLNVLANYYDRH